jgi:UDP-glucose 4-epimerase
VVLLSQAIRIAGKPALPIPEPLVNQVAELVGRTVDFSPEQVRFLQYGRVADTSAAAEELGFIPKWSSRQAFEDFAATRLHKLVTEEQVTQAEHEVLTLLRRAAGWIAREVPR